MNRTANPYVGRYDQHFKLVCLFINKFCTAVLTCAIVRCDTLDQSSVITNQLIDNQALFWIFHLSLHYILCGYSSYWFMKTLLNGNIFYVTGPLCFVRGIHRSPMNYHHRGQWRWALIFSLICAWINRWVNNHEAGDLRRHCNYYDVIVMC